MEHIPSNFPKHEIGDTHINKIIKEGESYLEANKESLEASLEYITHLTEKLEMQGNYFEHMNDANEMKQFLDDMAKEEGFEEKSLKEYSSEELKNAEMTIEKIKSEIKEIEDHIIDTKLDSVWMDGYLQQFRDVQQKFKQIVTKIHPDQSN